MININANTAAKSALSFILPGYICGIVHSSGNSCRSSVYRHHGCTLWKHRRSRFPKISGGNLAENTSAAMWCAIILKEFYLLVLTLGSIGGLSNFLWRLLWQSSNTVETIRAAVFRILLFCSIYIYLRIWVNIVAHKKYFIYENEKVNYIYIHLKINKIMHKMYYMLSLRYLFEMFLFMKSKIILWY